MEGLKPNERKEMERVMAHWQWYFVLGVVLLALGIAGMGIIPFVTIATVQVFGIFLVIGGVMLVISALFSAGTSGGARVFQLILALLYFAVGGAMIEEPLISAKYITWFIGVGFIIFGIVKVLMGFKTANGGLVVFSGVIDFFLGAMIMAGWPESTPWVIGLFVAIELIIAGGSYIALSLTGRALKSPA